MACRSMSSVILSECEELHTAGLHQVGVQRLALGECAWVGATRGPGAAGCDGINDGQDVNFTFNWV